MARNGSGAYSLPVNSWNPATNTVSASAADWQTLINDVATALTASLAADGQTTMTGNLPMGNNKLTGLAAGNAAGNSIRYEQVFGTGGLTALSASGGSDLSGFIQSGTGATARTAQGKLRDVVSVKDFGATGDGVTDDTAYFTAAAAAWNDIEVPAGTFNLSTTPTTTGAVIEVGADASLTGSGGTALGYTTSTKRQLLQSGTAGTDFALQYLRRNADHTGGSFGYVSSNLQAITYVGAGVTNFEWAIVGIVDSQATGGENVGGYFIGHKRGTGPVWGLLAEIIDYNVDPTTGAVAMEIDVSANGTDANVARVGTDLAIRKRDSGGAAPTVSWGHRIQVQAGATLNKGFGFYTGSTVVVGFDTSEATITQAAVKVAQNQAIAFNAAATKQLSYDGTGLKYSPDNGVTLAGRINDDGTYQIAASKVVGPRNTGWGAFTGVSNKATVYATGSITLAQLAERVNALQVALTTHGLIGA